MIFFYNQNGLVILSHAFPSPVKPFVRGARNLRPRAQRMRARRHRIKRLQTIDVATEDQDISDAQLAVSLLWFGSLQAVICSSAGILDHPP